MRAKKKKLFLFDLEVFPIRRIHCLALTLGSIVTQSNTMDVRGILRGDCKKMQECLFPELA